MIDNKNGYFTNQIKSVLGYSLVVRHDYQCSRDNKSCGLSGNVKKVGQAKIKLIRDALLLNHDHSQRGFGSAPKFPRESTHFLLNWAMRNNDAKALSAVNFSLIHMSAGGIHDQVGGGFHRYAVDDDWLVPHFEESDIPRLDDSLESGANQLMITMLALVNKLDKYSAALLEQRNTAPH